VLKHFRDAGLSQSINNAIDEYISFKQALKAEGGAIEKCPYLE
jgi:hypothetical protein